MSQNPVDNVPVLDAGDDRDGPTTGIANVSVDIETRLSRWAQDIATCRSAGERTSVLAIRFAPLRDLNPL